MAKRLVLAAVLVGAGGPAQAFQSEIDPQLAERNRENRIAFHREQERAARLAAAAATVTPAPITVPPSFPTYTGGVLSSEQVASYARGAGFPESVIPTMVAIAYRESGFDPAAVNDSSGACGLWQMYPCPGPEALNPATNAAMAYAKYAASGLSPWGY